jgi:hypothetical protein
MTPAEPSSMMERFAESGFEPVELHGELVHAMYRSAVAAGDVVRVIWETAESPRAQGLTLRLRIPHRSGRKGEGGRFRVGGIEAPTIVLWMDTAPPVVDAECVELTEVQLHCSDGYGDELTFDDLVVRIDVLEVAR